MLRVISSHFMLNPVSLVNEYVRQDRMKEKAINYILHASWGTIAIASDLLSSVASWWGWKEVSTILLKCFTTRLFRHLVIQTSLLLHPFQVAIVLPMKKCLREHTVLYEKLGLFLYISCFYSSQPTNKRYIYLKRNHQSNRTYSLSPCILSVWFPIFLISLWLFTQEFI